MSFVWSLMTGSIQVRWCVWRIWRKFLHWYHLCWSEAAEIGAVFDRRLFTCTPGLSLAVQVLHCTLTELEHGEAPLPNTTQSTSHSGKSWTKPFSASNHLHIPARLFNRAGSQLQLHTVWQQLDLKTAVVFSLTFHSPLDFFLGLALQKDSPPPTSHHRNTGPCRSRFHHPNSENKTIYYSFPRVTKFMVASAESAPSPNEPWRH